MTRPLRIVEAAVSLAVLALWAYVQLVLLPVVHRGIPDDPAVDLKRHYALDDAVAALARAGERFKTHGPTALRLDGPGLHAVTAVLDDWADVISQLPARTVVRCLRVTEQRMRALRNGHRTARDVRVMDITTGPNPPRTPQ